MAINLYCFDNDTVEVPNVLPITGLFIPATSLLGIEPTDFALNQQATLKYSKAIFAIIQSIYSSLSINQNKLGISCSITRPTVMGTSKISYSYSFSIDYLVDTATGKTKQIPVPTSGVYSGIGKVSLLDIFPNSIAIKSTADSNLITTAGILLEIPADYGFYNDVTGSTLATFNISGDCRYAIAAILASFIDGGVNIRTNTTPSGVISLSTSPATTIDIPANYYTTSNPISGINSADLDHLSIIRRTYSIAFELLLLPEYLEVNVSTT